MCRIAGYCTLSLFTVERKDPAELMAPGNAMFSEMGLDIALPPLLSVCHHITKFLSLRPR